MTAKTAKAPGARRWGFSALMEAIELSSRVSRGRRATVILGRRNTAQDVEDWRSWGDVPAQFCVPPLP